MAASFPPELQEGVVHARLSGEMVEIPASDWLAQNRTPVRGNMTCMYIDGISPERSQEIFAQLSPNGEITDSFSRQPFGWYGRLVDAFGVIWMFHALET
jgi:uncharacterized glyoxalase superfamily protein PhnB